MSVDFITCECCGGTFPDCGPWTQCAKEHSIGPCCLREPDEDQEDDDGALLCQHCPVCNAGGSTREQLTAAQARISELEKDRDQLKEGHAFENQLWSEASQNHAAEYHRIATAIGCHVRDDLPTKISAIVAERDALRTRAEKAESERDLAMAEVTKWAREAGLAQARAEKAEGDARYFLDHARVWVVRGEVTEFNDRAKPYETP